MQVADFLLQNLTIRKQSKNYCECDCPVCGGKLKVCLNSSAYGAYKCWTKGCSSKDIRRAAGLPEINKSEVFRNSGLFAKSDIFQNPDNSLSTPPVEFSGTQLAQISKYVNLKQSLTISISSSKKLERKIYEYSLTQRVMRLDDSGSKKVYIQYWDSSWLNGSGDNTWDFYTYGLENIYSGDTIIFVEGEKTCEFVKSSGWACITAMSGNYNIDNLFINFLTFKKQFPNIKNIVYFPDDDEPGYHKAAITKLAAWKSGLGFHEESIKQFNPQSIKGFDLADLNPRELESYLKNYNLYANQRTKSTY